MALCLSGEEIPLVSTNAIWTYFEGTQEASLPDMSQWRLTEFDDDRWSTGESPFHTSKFEGKTLVDFSETTSLYLRQPFEVTDKNQFSEIALSASIDDGLIAWVNGYEVLRYNVPAGDLRFNATASRSVREPIQPFDHLVPDVRSILTNGTNTLAIHAFNASRPTARTDFFFAMTVSGIVDQTPPQIESIIPAPDRTLVQMETIEIFFDEAVMGISAEDLRIQNHPATSVRKMTDRQYLFGFPEPEAGHVSISWSSNAGINDLAGNPITLNSWTYELNPEIAIDAVRITEFMANNGSTINDENGDRSDWIEIHNGSEADIFLQDWSLTDSISEPTKWRFPNIVLPANDYLLVFASGKNRSQRFGQLHTNFKLAAEGEYLALTAPSDLITSEFKDRYPSQFEDVSYGMIQGTQTTTGFFTEPSPNQANKTGGSGFTSEIEFSRTSGTFADNFRLTLSTGQQDATIKYTLDGNLPTETSRTFTGPLLIRDSTEIRARAFHPILLPGKPRSETFTKLEPSLTPFRSSLPIMLISRLGSQRINGSRNTPVHFSIFEPEGGSAYIHSKPTFAHRGAAKTRGSSTGGLQKASWAIEWRDEFGEDENEAVLGMPAESEWVLYAPNQFDPIMIHNPFLHQLSRDVGDYSPRTRFVEVFLNEGGALDSSQYEGVYVLEEKISIGKNRVDIDKLRPENITLPEVSGGYLLKIDRPDPGDSGISALGTRVLWVAPKESEIETPRGSPNHPQEDYITGFLNQFYETARGSQWRDPNVGYHTFIDTDQWINFHILEVLSGNVDSLVLSTYLHKPRNGKLKFGPHWDFDRALGSTDGRDANPASWHNGPFFSAPPFSQLLRDPDFWQKWVDRWQTLRGEQLSLIHINAIIDDLTDQVRPAVPREIQRWRTRMRGGTYETEIAHMKNWLRRKIEFIDAQMTLPPRFNLPSGPVSADTEITLHSTGEAQIYYTTDGSDPRLSDGELSPSARRYQQGLKVSESTRFIARANDSTKRQSAVRREVSTPWSAPIEAIYTVRLPKLVLSEIMFHPTIPESALSDNEDDFEFIEILNVGHSAESLAGLRLENGIRYNFENGISPQVLAPGERLIIAQNAVLLKLAYPNVSNLIGDFSGSLANDRDTVTLVNDQGHIISEVTYDDRWYPLADGIGFSLVTIDENSTSLLLSNPDAWRPSSIAGGSPGLSDPVATRRPDIEINEVQAYRAETDPDRIELYNSGKETIDLSGWFLTDTLTNPRKLQIKAGISIAPDQHIDLSGEQLVDNSELKLSRLGDALFLFSTSNDGRLTHLVDMAIFRGSGLNDSYGRHLDSSGMRHFIPLPEPSFGKPNPAPMSSEVVVRTISYIPLNRDGTENKSFEFIEISNLSTETTPLYLPADGSVPWRLRGAVEFEFPEKFSLAPLESVTLVGFDPETSPARLSDFKAFYAATDNFRILGPWKGNLANSGDHIQLLKPISPPKPNDDIAFQSVEHVIYTDTNPWPTISASTSQVLNRTSVIGFSGDAENWIAAPPHDRRSRQGSRWTSRQLGTGVQSECRIFRSSRWAARRP